MNTSGNKGTHLSTQTNYSYKKTDFSKEITKNIKGNDTTLKRKRMCKIYGKS